MSVTLEPPALPPFWLPILAGLPIGLCMVVMALPVLGSGHAAAYRALYLVAYLVWIVPLTVVQRGLWRRRTTWWASALALFTITYVMALANNALGVGLALVAGWGRSPAFAWSELFRGIDGCWLALISFCAIHAVVAYYAELRHEQARCLAAVSLARDAELRALRYQLHPHFLFNTLNAISALVVDQRGREACDMIARLGDFLRATLEGTGSHEVTLAEELALTGSYLAIEKVRLGDRLDLKWNVGADVLGALVPYLLLQPLAENAIRHGIARRTRPGRLEIQASRVGGRLHLCLRNDGVPCAAATAGGDRPSMVGLANVTERLAKLYPGDHAMAARQLDDGGYEVNIELPFREGAASDHRLAAA
jgi:two-component system sensor histidine kinase AlgZ